MTEVMNVPIDQSGSTQRTVHGTCAEDRPIVGVMTSNGFEIKNPMNHSWTAQEFRERMATEYGLTGKNPAERLKQFKELSVEGIAIMLEDINKSLQGSQDSLMAVDRVMKIGEEQTVDVEHRYEVFNALINDIKATTPDTNPARVGDVLALGVVLLHTFEDGSGRTARTLGLLFRDEYDIPDEYQADFDVLTKSRDELRKIGGTIPYGYIPCLKDGASRSNSNDVIEYLHELLHKNANDTEPYVGPYGVAPLRLRPD